MLSQDISKTGHTIRTQVIKLRPVAEVLSEILTSSRKVGPCKQTAHKNQPHAPLAVKEHKKTLLRYRVIVLKNTETSLSTSRLDRIVANI